MMDEAWMESGSVGHVPVMARAVLDALGVDRATVYADATAGLGGHAIAAAARMPADGVVVLNDADGATLERARALVAAASPGRRVEAIQGNFAELPRRLAERGLAADAVLADLGFSSVQVDEAGRGFSFMRDGPLDMRFDPTRGASAADLVATMSVEELAAILWEYGEERGSRRVAERIVARRAVRPISTTGDLASVVVEALGPRGGGPRIHPATRTFQGLRIAVNDELGCLRSFLESVGRAAAQHRSGAGHGTSWLRPGARVAIITFHSLEDRIVKEAVRDMEARGVARSVTRKPIEAGAHEVARNPRSRSAKVRAVELCVV
jgi:16S rRNA (cytosine1402-N4)-methyltransferase